MGGYGDDLFHLLFRACRADDRRRLPADEERQHDSAAMAFMRDHGVSGHLFRSTGTGQDGQGRKVSVRTVKAPGFGPKGVLRCVLPFTVFLKLKDIGGNVLPPFDEEFREVAMDTAQAAAYRDLAGQLTRAEAGPGEARHDAARCGAQRAAGLAGLLLRSETGVPRRAQHLGVRSGSVPAGGDAQGTRADRDLQAGEGRRSQDPGLFGHRRATPVAFEGCCWSREGFKVAVLRASVDASAAGLDRRAVGPWHRRAHHQSRAGENRPGLAGFPTIVFLQSGYNVYSLQQAARRSWRIGQKQPVRVIYLGYANSSQMTCLGLMAGRSWCRRARRATCPSRAWMS